MASSFSVIDIYSEDNDVPIYVPTVRSKRALYTAIVSLLVVVAVIIAVELVGVFYALNLFSVVDNKEPVTYFLLILFNFFFRIRKK